MSLEPEGATDPRPSRGTGPVHKRLEEARRQRESILNVPTPANDDPLANTHVPRSFPTLKPPIDPEHPRSSITALDWAIPWLLGLLIFAVIFAFAVG